MSDLRDHGGGLDVAIARYGASRADWLDLSTGINPVPYPVGEIPDHAWSALPDSAAMDRLLTAARKFWAVPEDAQIIAAPGASALIARMPDLTDNLGTYIPTPTYNEHAAAFLARHQLIDQHDPQNAVHVYVHPNNPDGRLWPATDMGGRPLTIIDESFCDVAPEVSHVALTEDAGIIILKSFGKFWGLAGLRLGFAIGRRESLNHDASLTELLGPWAVSGPALEIGARALEDVQWAQTTRTRLAADSDRLDRLMTKAGARVVGGTTLFRLYEVANANAAQTHLAQHRIWSRIFPYSKTWLRLGLPHPDRWDQLETAIGTAGGAMRLSASGV